MKKLISTFTKEELKAVKLEIKKERFSRLESFFFWVCAGFVSVGLLFINLGIGSAIGNNLDMAGNLAGFGFLLFFISMFPFAISSNYRDALDDLK